MKEKLLKVYQQIKPYIHKTPVLTSTQLDVISGCRLFFKCENFQKMGAFKMRGALNAIAQLSKAEQAKGVVTHSSGNFAQAIALAAKKLGITAYIVMPENAPGVKKNAAKGYGGIVIECPPNIQAREAYTAQLVTQKGLTFIHPSNDMNVILGNATAAKELVEEVEDLDYILSPVGGGGLVAGTILATQSFSPNTKVIGCEPSAVDDAYHSLESGKIESQQGKNTIADGLKTYLGDVNFPIIRQGIDRIILVDEDEIVAAMQLIWERMKIVIEPSSAVTLAALLKQKNQFKDKKVGLILSGGNVDLKKIPF